uniref:Saposin B-type domain-containing protein n=1 Tax=Catharus ustulatus TaxID=91951 RepID=A0A8C3V675_CATUS
MGRLGQPGPGKCPTPKYCQGHPGMAGVQAALRIFVSSQGNVADGDSVAPVRGFKCSQCTKVLKKIKALAGDDPDEDAVAAALQKGCRLLGRSMGRRCQKFVKKYKDQITEGLQNGDMPQDICAAVGFCRS